MNKSYSRRSFIRNLVLGAASIPLVTIGSNKSYAQPAITIALDENDSLAKTFGYVHDHNKADKVKFPKKAAPDGDKQLCKNCILYLEGGKKIEGTPGEWGKCGLFQNGLVNADGWCNSFAMKV